MKIGIISDSHDHHKNVRKAVAIFNEHGVDYVFHAGDIVSPATAQLFAELDKAKFIAVFGNCDSERTLLKDCINSFGGEIHNLCYDGEVGGKRIFMTHKLRGPEKIICSGKFDLVIYGHTHKRDIQKLGQTTVINPGLSAKKFMGNSQIIVLELDNMQTEEVPLIS